MLRLSHRGLLPHFLIDIDRITFSAIKAFNFHLCLKDDPGLLLGHEVQPNLLHILAVRSPAQALQVKLIAKEQTNDNELAHVCQASSSWTLKEQACTAMAQHSPRTLLW